MTWFRVDDSFPKHPKVLCIPRGARRLAAVGAWTEAGAWSSGAGTNGALPAYVLDDLGVPARVAEDLVNAGLWERTPTGFQVHDFLDYNPSAEEVEEDRARKHEARSRAGRAGGIASGVARRKHGESKTEAKPKQVASTTGKQNEAPSRPVPTLKEQTPSVSGPRKRGTTAPDLFPITAELAEWGRENAPLITDPRSETLRFLDHHRAKGSLFKDWTAAWRTWMRNAQTFAERDQPKPEQKRAEPAWMR